MHNALKQLIIVAFALVFMAGAAFAQSNTTTLSQDGNDDARLKQVNGSTATITQAQGANVVRGISDPIFNQQGSDLTVTQAWGASNRLRGEQLGNNNTATVTQHNNSFAQVEQKGVRNEVSLQQYLAHEQRFYLEQKGDRNSVSFIQINGVNGSFADISQKGNRNVVDGLDAATTLGPSPYQWKATQRWGDQTLNLIQKNDKNALYLFQGGSDDGSANGNNAAHLEQKNGSYGEVLQIGDNNQIRGVNSMMAISNSSTFFVSQTGAMNTLKFDQTSANNTLDVTQDGINNYSQVQQN
jgi:hypothetical protein